MDYKDKITKMYKSYVAKWTAITVVVGMVTVTAGWVSGVHNWINIKVDTYIEIQKEGVINNADSLIRQAIAEEKEYYNGVINKKDEVFEELHKIVMGQVKRDAVIIDAMLGELDRVDKGGFNIWVSDSGKGYYEENGKLYIAWFESNKQRWMYRDYVGKVHKCGE